MTRLADILAERGPLTGAELVAAGDFTDVLELWRACHAPGFALRRTGRRYLRLDYAVDGYARLSPSIRREFLTYTLVGLPDQTAALAARVPTNQLLRRSAALEELRENLGRTGVQEQLAIECAFLKAFGQAA